jgi:hypothetical protein
MVEWNIVQDVDECLVNSVPKHAIATPLIARRMGYDQLAATQYTPEELGKLGGSSGGFNNIPGYKVVNHFLRHDPNFNRGLEPIPGAQETITSLENRIAAILTTRPEHLTELTRDELSSLGYPELPIITRPRSVCVEHTAEWKYQQLLKLSEADGKAKLMIDDSHSTVKYIMEKNNPKIKALLYDGPMTKDGLGASSWKEIEVMLHATEDWKSVCWMLNILYKDWFGFQI